MCKWLINFSPSTEAKDRLSSIYCSVPKPLLDSIQSVLQGGLEQFHLLKQNLRKFEVSHIPSAGLNAYFILIIFLT